MHDYPFDVTAVRLAVIVGVILTTIFYERIQLTTGGAIVPGYLALFTPAPLFIAMSLFLAYATFYLVNQVIAKRYILYGRRKFEVEILTGLVLNSVSVGLAHLLVGISPLFLALYGIGFVIPAIIAHDMFRQGAPKTLIAVLTNTGIIAVFVYVVQFLLREAPWQSGEPVALLGVGDLGYPRDLLLPAVIASVAAGMFVFRYLHLRTGGFVTGAYLALMLLRPVDLLFAGVVALVSYLFVTRVAMRQVLAFGRRKLSLMVVTASILAWLGEVALGLLTGGNYVPWRGFHVITLMIPALLANDSERQGPYRTFWGAAITTVAVFTAMNLVDAARLFLQTL
jgi:poly-gamma-glutamate biosynthesis protein PgsC/CapC